MLPFMTYATRKKVLGSAINELMCCVLPSLGVLFLVATSMAVSLLVKAVRMLRFPISEVMLFSLLM